MSLAYDWIRAPKGTAGGDGTPTPGNAFAPLHGEPGRGRCPGFIGFVVEVAPNGKSYNTIEGNCGNRVEIGRRSMTDPMLKRFINIIGDYPRFKRGELRGAKALDSQGTR